eukprot:gene12458-12593_t
MIQFVSMAAGHKTQLTDLDDACLLGIFKHLVPLPDLFQVAQTCWRFHHLTSDKRMWLVVAPSSILPDATPSGHSGPRYHDLRAAVTASRPGDTIWLAPGMVHDATNISITKPLHIVGGGLHPEDTRLTAAPGADFSLCFSASAKVAMLSVSATLCPCLLHKRGLLTVERLANVRVIYESRATLFWLEVDSTNTGNGSSSPVSTVLPAAVGLTPAVCWCSSSRAVENETVSGKQEGYVQEQQPQGHQLHSLAEKEKLWQNSRTMTARCAGTYSLRVPGQQCTTPVQHQDQLRSNHEGVQPDSFGSPSRAPPIPMVPGCASVATSAPGASASLLGGLARIQQRLKSIHPATLAHHLASRGWNPHSQQSAQEYPGAQE